MKDILYKQSTNPYYISIFTIMSLSILFTFITLNLLNAKEKQLITLQQSAWSVIETERQLQNTYSILDEYMHAPSKETEKALVKQFFKYENQLYILLRAPENISFREQEDIKLFLDKIYENTERIEDTINHITETSPQNILSLKDDLKTLSHIFSGLSTRALQQNSDILSSGKFDIQNNIVRILIVMMLCIAFSLVAFLIRMHHKTQKIQEQFYEAQKMETLGRMASGIAHDFNNILASITGYSELLIDDLQFQKKQRGFSLQIQKACVQAQQLVDQILSFTKRSQLTKEPTNIIDEIHNTMNMLRTALRPGIDLIKDLKVNNAIVLSNNNQIHQVLMNICVNAGDAIEDNSGVIKITADTLDLEDKLIKQIISQQQNDLSRIDVQKSKQTLIKTSKKQSILLLGSISSNKEYIRISISDTGSGMDQETIEHIFAPLFTTKGATKGTGLGLSAVSGIISEHNGALIVESEIGKGTQFNIILPLSKEAVVTKHASFNQEETPLTHGVGNILLVEDDLDVAIMISTTLERLGYEVLHCLNGKEALDAIEAEPEYYKIVISDYKMPKITGIDLAKKIKAISSNLPVIILTGYEAEELDKYINQDSNIKAVMKKPVDKVTLSKKIIEIIGEDLPPFKDKKELQYA